MVRPHKQLMVWQESMALVEQVYLLTASFPGDERFGLISQLRRAAVPFPPISLKEPHGEAARNICSSLLWRVAH